MNLGALSEAPSMRFIYPPALTLPVRKGPPLLFIRLPVILHSTIQGTQTFLATRKDPRIDSFFTPDSCYLAFRRFPPLEKDSLAPLVAGNLACPPVVPPPVCLFHAA